MALCMGKAAQAQVDREQACLRKSLRGFDRLLAGAAAGNQDVDVRLAEIAEWRRRESAAQELVDGPRPSRGLTLHPTRIWVFLVLVPHRDRHGVLDRRQHRDRSPQLPL